MSLNALEVVGIVALAVFGVQGYDWVSRQQATVPTSSIVDMTQIGQSDSVPSVPTYHNNDDNQSCSYSYKTPGNNMGGSDGTATFSFSCPTPTPAVSEAERKAQRIMHFLWTFDQAKA